ncbi:SDR family oxidoreductase [Candidatus Methylopumilus planktonicus]|uniref:SDR family oxidoreductase n=1 Tax=Candidatus Methylopumilus planktonicus TaxID=1581557 RepID=UPI003D18F9E2
MRILIVGGFGYLGGRIASYLAQVGHQIVLGSRKTVVSPSWLKNAGVVKIEWDNINELERSCSGIDLIIHAAGMNAQDCLNNPIEAVAFNGSATGMLVEAACKAKVERFIYLSTAHVYSDPLTGVITEKTLPKNTHPYATSHLLGEQYLLAANKSGQIKGAVLRLSNAFGAPTDKKANCWMLLINDLCKQAVETKTLILKTNSSNERDFIPLKEVCYKIQEFIIPEKYSSIGIFNVGNGSSKTILSVAEIIQLRCIEVLGFKPQIKTRKNKFGIKTSSLKYLSDKIPNYQINYKGHNWLDEIDELLEFCSKNFKKI